MVGIAKSALSSTGYRVYLAFIITQHIRDELLMKCLINYLDCKLSKRDVYEFQVAFLFSDLTDKVLKNTWRES